LLGLVKEGSGVAANVLQNLMVELKQVRLEVEKIVKPGPEPVRPPKLPLTLPAKKVLELALEEAKDLGHNYLGTEHLLLGLLREHDGVAGQVLIKLGLRLEDVRKQVFTLFGKREPRARGRTRIGVAPDSFKECLSAAAVADAIERGLRKAVPDCEVVKVPMADGGEGTVAAMVAATGGQIVTEEVTAPLGDKVKAQYGLLGDGATAVIEMAAASGLPLVPPEKRNPLVTTTFGTGELVKSALARGAKKIIMGIGGSATVDGGAGMAQALGVKLLDASGQPIGFGGGELARVARIDMSGLDPRAKASEFVVACDVDNPLLGPRGAAAVFGPQKGATLEMVGILDANLAHLAGIIERDLGRQVKDMPGAGAAGGLGAGLVAFLNATLRRGVELVVEAVQLRERLRGCQLVITGEGRLDGQSVFGKTPIGVARVAKSLGIPVIALAGSLGQGCEETLQHGIDAYFSIVNRPMTLEEAMAKASELLAERAEQVLRAALLLDVKRKRNDE